MRRGESELLKSFDLFFARPDVHLRPISQNILRLGAEFRAHYAKLRAPDAIHLATAVDAEAALIVTNDKAWTGTVATEILLIDSYI
jgi:predicted nucleic acid-binding protein